MARTLFWSQHYSGAVGLLDQKYQEFFVIVDQLHPPIVPEGSHSERRQAVQRLSERGNMKKVIGVIILALSIGCLTADAQLPSCKDGSLRFDFAAVPSGIYLMSVSYPEPVVTFYLYGGKFVPCGMTGNTPPGHFYRFRTGPRTDGGAPGDYTHGATFGPGGWFHLYASDNLFGHYFLACGAKGIPCTFDAVSKYHQPPAWDSATLTLKQLPNGTYVYEMTGTLSGTYTDAVAGVNPNVKAIFSQQTINSAGMLFGADQHQEFGGGALQVVNQTQ
jgi:hypothetical protein